MMLVDDTVFPVLWHSVNFGEVYNAFAIGQVVLNFENHRAANDD